MSKTTGRDSAAPPCSPRRCEFVRQVPDGNGGFIDRGVFETRHDLEGDMSLAGADGARGIMRDCLNGEWITVVAQR